MREPLDTDREMPVVLDREAAMARLLDLIGPEAADAIWDEIIAPLYDARTMTRHWRRGSCIRCSVDHPARWPNTLNGRKGQPWPGHRMHCPLYVGPLEHRITGGHQGFAGWRNLCSCGQSWLDDVWADPRPGCPDAGLDWRGPAPVEGGGQP